MSSKFAKILQIYVLYYLFYGRKTAVLLALAVMRAGLDCALDGGVGGASAAAVGIIRHEKVPPEK